MPEHTSSACDFLCVFDFCIFSLCVHLSALLFPHVAYTTLLCLRLVRPMHCPKPSSHTVCLTSPARCLHRPALPPTAAVMDEEEKLFAKFSVRSLERELATAVEEEHKRVAVT